MSDTQARLDAITVALDRLLEQDSWEHPYVKAGREALTALAAALVVVERKRDTLRAALDHVCEWDAGQRFVMPPWLRSEAEAALAAVSPEGEA
jgi:hypothetical protein